MNSYKEKVDGVINSALKNIKSNILEIENREDLNDDEKVERIIKIFGATCAGVAIQPIPFADIFVLTPIQAYMGSRIAAIRKVPISEGEAKEVFLQLASVVGMGLLAQQLVIGAYKTFIPFLGALTTIPLVFGLTYAMGKVMNEYFIRKNKRQKTDPETLKNIWKEALKKGKAEGKANKVEIKEESKALSVDTSK